MNAHARRSREATFGIGAALLMSLATGCALTPNFYRETGPSTTMAWSTPSSTRIAEHHQPAPARQRGWATMDVAPENGAVDHYPSYFEDPFEDKGDGRTDATDPHNVYRLGWEDWVAFPYSISRFTLNWLLFPVSVIVTPPCTVMQSDGEVSKQFLGYDHDAAPVKKTWLGAPTVAEGKAGSPSAGAPPEPLDYTQEPSAQDARPSEAPASNAPKEVRE